jgi:RNA polymerase sigma-70 factor (ECF subfamily)
VARDQQRQLAALVRRHLDSDDEAAEVAQEAIVHAFQNLTTFRGDSSLQTWLSRIAINLAIDRKRSKGRGRAAEGHRAEEPTTSPLRTTRVAARETLRAVGALIAELPPKQALAVRLRLIEDLPFREVAEALESSEDAARVNFHLGMKVLRERLRSGAKAPVKTRE